MEAILKFKIFNQIESEINFDSFVKFPLFVFRLVFIKFDPLPASAAKKEKFKYYARRAYNMLTIMCFVISVLSKFVLVINSENVQSASPLLLDVASYFLNEVKVSHNIIYRREIWNIFEEM